MAAASSFSSSSAHAAVVAVDPISSQGALCASMEEYHRLYKRSLDDNEGFWRDMANQHVSWFRPFDRVRQGDFASGDIAWFLNGQLNVCYNCVDRHVPQRGDKVAILWEGDDAKDVRRITYRELQREVCRVANALKKLGVRKGDPVSIYMPMVPEAAFAMLACARLGAPHSVVFAGFSAESLRDRILDTGCRVVITADEGVRAGRTIPLKVTVDQALTECPGVSSVLVLRRTGAQVPFRAPRDVWWHEAVEAERPYCPPTWVDSEDYLFFLYTSGSTGKPKGVVHSSGGYLLYAALTHRYVFDCRENDVYACVADLGWVTGHSYILYGPLCNGVTTFMFESTPLYPDASRYWDMVERHRFTVFYTAPTAIRALMKFGPDAVKKHDLSSLRMLGSVGEPINPEAWRWYHDVVGGGKRSVVDTFWQTETGGIMITGLPGCTPMKPGAASLPFFGVEPAVLDEHGHELPQTEATGILVMKRPWPGIARTVYGDHHRFMRTYMTVFRGYYFTGDGCIRDKDGYYWITGRVDDVINVSGHRIGSAEVESALVANKKVAEAAVVGVPHDLKGQTLFAYVTLKVGVEHTPELEQQLRDEVKTHIGSFAKPDYILITPSLPKTRSGKIMRRLLRKIGSLEIAPEQLGDTTTLADPSVVDHLIAQVKKLLHK